MFSNSMYNFTSREGISFLRVFFDITNFGTHHFLIFDKSFFELSCLSNTAQGETDLIV